MSTFSALNAATTALWAQRRALDVTGQNIANVNTEGYSRQRVDLQAIGGSVVPAFYSTSPGIGAGVSADDVTRIRDAFLEGRGHIETANQAQMTVQADSYEQVEAAFREPGETGIQSLLSDVWDGFEDLANNPQDDPARKAVLVKLDTLVGGIHFSQEALGAQWGQTRENLQVLVKDVNASAVTIAELNKAIKNAHQSDLPANDLTDQRDLLVMKLAGQVGATVRPGDNGVVDVVIGGMTLVAGSKANQLAVAGATDPDGIAVDGKPRIVTAVGEYTVPAGGTAGGQISVLGDIIPSYRDQLDTLAQDFVTSLNAQHQAGFDRNGNPGKPILTGTNATDIALAGLTPAEVAASSVGDPLVPSPNSDKGNADKIAALRDLPLGTDTAYRKMIVQLGVQASVADRNLDIQSVITTQVDAARESVAGVNLDEEMTNMLSYQHAYSAAGRMITAIDETLDQLINRTGLVGR